MPASGTSPGPVHAALVLLLVPLARGIHAARAQSQSRGPALAPKRVAIVTSGSMLRFVFNSTAQNLIAPLVRDGHSVDYFVTLNMESFRSWTPGANAFVQDPQLRGGPDALKRTVEDLVRRAGGTLQRITLNRKMDLNAQEQLFLEQAGWNKHAKFDASELLPYAFWLYKDKQWTPKMLAARTNLLKMLRALQDLWQQVEEVERLRGRYDFVIFQKDDSHWMEPFRISSLLDLRSAASKPGFGFSLQCDKDVSFLDTQPDSLTEYAFLFDRAAAEVFGQQYGHLFTSQPELASKYWGAKNLESFSFNLARDNDITVTPVPPAMMPIQRVGFLAVNKSARGNVGTSSSEFEEVALCLHKWCDTLAKPNLRPMRRLAPCEAWGREDYQWYVQFLKESRFPH